MRTSDFRCKGNGTNLPLVTIGILSYNNEKYLVECLESIRHQTYSPIQLVINDDCSTDNSVEVIKNWINDYNLDVTLLVQEKNKGITASCNAILSVAGGEYISLLGSDDYIRSDRIQRCVQKFNSIPEDVGMLYTDMQYINDKGHTIDHSWNYPFLKGYVYNEFANKQFRMYPPSMIYRKQIFDQLKFDESLLVEDIDFQSRALYHWKVDFINEKTVYYRFNSESSLKRQNSFKYLKQKYQGQKRRIKHLPNLSKDLKQQYLREYIKTLKQFIFSKNLTTKYYSVSMVAYFFIIFTPLRSIFYPASYFFGDKK